ncbi:MAG: DNA/RNA non-specific endonuclease [Rikenellaceae bacterium]
MIKQTIAALLFVSTTPLLAQYQPEAVGEFVQHTHYSLDYNEQHEQPNWVYYIFTPDMANGSSSRSNSFKADPTVSSGSATPSDYVKSGYDRGHLCPAGDMSFSSTAMKESFYMSNMSPQNPSFNRGIWRSCESYIRTLDCDTLYVVTGPIFRDNIGSIGKNSVTVPGAYYKVAYNPSTQKMWAFIIPNAKVSGELSDYRTSVDSVEIVTGIDLYYQLPDDLETELEK